MRPITILSRATLVALTLLLCAHDARAQDEAAVRDLVQSIRRNLADVDRLLDEASEAPSVEEQLASAREAHVRTIAELERLIRMVRYSSSGGSGSGGGGQPPPSGGSSGSQPPPRDADGSRGGEETGSPPPAPGSDPRAEQGAQDGEDSLRPEGSAGADSAGTNREGDEVPPDPTAPFERRDTDARWGLLPPKLQERLFNLHVDDVPDRYRDRLADYIRELNRRDERRRP